MRAACALELHLPSLALRVDHLAQVHGRAIAELTRKVTKLMSAVTVCSRLGPR